MKRMNEKGSFTAVIICILFLALMAALGVVFYQNFIEKKDDGQATVMTDENGSLKKAQVAFNSEIYELDYPKTGWSLATEKIEGSPLGSTVKVTNTKKTVQVSLSVSELPQNPACNPGDGLKVSYYKVSTKTVKGLINEPLYLVETMSDFPGGGYQYLIGLVPDSGDTHSNVGETHCNVSHVGIASSAVNLEGKLEQPTIVAKIDFPGQPLPPKPSAKEMQELKDIMKTDDYKSAVTILESARKK